MMGMTANTAVSICCAATVVGAFWRVPTPSGTNPFAAHVGRNLEKNVADVKDGQDGVVVVALEMEVLLEAGQACIANIGPVNEAEEVEESDGWDNVEVNLHSQARLCVLVKVHQGMAIAVHLINTKPLDGVGHNGAVRTCLWQLGRVQPFGVEDRA